MLQCAPHLNGFYLTKNYFLLFFVSICSRSYIPADNLYNSKSDDYRNDSWTYNLYNSRATNNLYNSWAPYDLYNSRATNNLYNSWATYNLYNSRATYNIYNRKADNLYNCSPMHS